MAAAIASGVDTFCLSAEEEEMAEAPGVALEGAVALIGQAGFFADGVIAYAVFPPIAKSNPAALDLDGFMFTGPNYSAYTAFAVLFMFGYLVLGISLLYYRALPVTRRVPYVAEICACALILGSILANLPPTAGFGVICAGGILWGSGALIIGTLWTRAEFTSADAQSGGGGGGGGGGIVDAKAVVTSDIEC